VEQFERCVIDAAEYCVISKRKGRKRVTLNPKTTKRLFVIVINKCFAVRAEQVRPNSGFNTARAVESLRVNPEHSVGVVKDHRVQEFGNDVRPTQLLGLLAQRTTLRFGQGTSEFSLGIRRAFAILTVHENL
jgi:hypothetical protein